MGSWDDGLPNEAFTDAERAAGVVGIMRGNSRRIRTDRGHVVTVDDCISLIVRSVVLQEIDTAVHVAAPDDHEHDYEFSVFAGLTNATVDKSRFSLLLGSHHCTARVLFDALRKIELPFFEGGLPWLAWDRSTQSLLTNLEHSGGHQNRCFWPDGVGGQLTVPKEPERARVFELLRTAYLSSDHGHKPLLVRSEHLADAFAKRVIPFEEARQIERKEIDHYSLVYVAATGDVSEAPLQKALDERVTISTRTGSLYGYGLRPSLNESVLWANSFRLAVRNHPSSFRYYLRRNKGTIFQTAFEQIDLPSSIKFWNPEPREAERSANALADWAVEREAKLFVAVDGHPLQSDDCDSVSTPQHYASAVNRLRVLGFTIGDGSRNDATIYLSESGELLRFASNGPYSKAWAPSGAHASLGSNKNSEL